MGLISSFLTTRHQYVVCGNSASSLLPCSYGVPQGSVLGPLLFLIFINDFSLAIRPFQSVLYADDTTLLISGCTPDELECNVGVVETLASRWFITNRLKLSEDKTQKITFSTTTNEQQVALLGVRVDQSLRWKSHVEALSTRLSTSLFVLRRLRAYLADEALIGAYYGIVHSHLTYAITLWGNSVGSLAVFRLQKRALRIIARIRPRDTCRNAFTHFNILTLPCLFIFYSLIEIHRTTDQYVRHLAVHDHNTRFANNFVTIRSRIRLASINRPNLNLYNALPTEMRDLPATQFRNALRNFLSSHAFYSVEEYFSSARMLS